MKTTTGVIEVGRQRRHCSKTQKVTKEDLIEGVWNPKDVQETEKVSVVGVMVLAEVERPYDRKTLFYDP